LSLCKKMGGDIKVYSQVGEGTQFVALLKCEVQTIEEENKQESTRAMIVEANVPNLGRIKGLLEKLGVNEVCSVSNGNEALEKFKSQGDKYYDVVFMDVDSQELDGLRMSTNIRQHEVNNKWNPTFLVILSENCNSSLLQDCLNTSGNIRANYVFGKDLTLCQCQKVLSTKKDLKSKIVDTNMVLIVDDDIFNCKILGDFVTLFGADYIFAHNGEEAIKAVAAKAPYLKAIFMDCEMPIMDGYTASVKIREMICREKWRNIPIFGITGNSGQYYKTKCLESGMKASFTKPVSYETIKNVMKSLVT